MGLKCIRQQALFTSLLVEYSVLSKQRKKTQIFFFFYMISIKIFQPHALIACGISPGVVVY